MNISIIKGKDNGCIYIKGEVYINGEVIYLNKYKKLRDAFTKKEQKVEITPKGNFYKQSEMAALMLLMYETNAENKQLILEGKQPKAFPEEFLIGFSPAA